jgi:nucleoside-triphosphatase
VSTRDGFNSPADLLASCFFEEHHPPTLLLLSGPSGAGKTTWLVELAELARAQKFALGGLLSLPVYAAGQKTGIDLLDLATGARRRLAELRLPAQATAVESIYTEDWQFDPQALAWGNQALSHTPACHLLILDELGPVEWERGRGLQTAFELVERRGYRLAIAVIRPALLGQALRRWPAALVYELAPMTKQLQRVSGA